MRIRIRIKKKTVKNICTVLAGLCLLVALGTEGGMFQGSIGLWEGAAWCIGSVAAFGLFATLAGAIKTGATK